MRRREFEVRVDGGRRLYAEAAGPEDAALVVFHSGTPGTRYSYAKHLEQCLERGLRHVCYSRPGYDGSDRQPGRSVADCAADTGAVADALGAESFYVVGHSGGGEPALACAALLPDRVRSVAALATLAPRSADGLDWWGGLKKLNLEEFEALEAGDAALERFLEEAAEEMRGIRSVAQLRDSLGDTLPPVDRDSLEGGFLEYQLASYPVAVRGGIWGWFDDDQATWKDWGFDLARIGVPVSVWQGKEDWFVPAAHGEWLARHLPGCRFHLFADEGHLSLLENHYGAVLDELIASGA